MQDDATARTRKRLIIAAGAVLAAVVTVLGVLQLLPAGAPAPAADDSPPPQLTAGDITNQFLTALTSGDAAAAGELTDDPAGATAQLTAVWQSLRPRSASADRIAPVAPAADATAVDERFTLTWLLGPGSWSYESALRVVRTAPGWRVQWQPALVHPRLAVGQSLALRDVAGQPAVVDRDGTPLLVRTPDGTAAADPAVAPRLVGGMGRVATEQGPAGSWYVALVDAAGAELEVLHGTPAAPVVSTVGVPVQRAAQAAVDSQQQPAMLVAIQPSTGDILAVAQNSAAGADPVALTGLYPPGSTFKVVTAAAILDAGIAGIDTVVPCPGSVTVGQRTVDNDGFDLGEVPLRTAFAESCNTTFASQASGLPQDALVRAAGQFGLGADFTVPGITTETGSVPAAASPAELVESSFGQGRVQTSCFGLALMSATVAAGNAVTPRLWRDLPTAVDVPYTPPPAGVTRALRTMMREVVRSGTGSALSGFGNVFGKTGTAQVGDGTQAHGWFAGYRDDLAFATFVEYGSSSASAVDVTGKFLGALG